MAIKGTIIRAHVAVTAAYILITNVHRLKMLRTTAVRGFSPVKAGLAITTPAIHARLKDRPAFQSKRVGTLHRVGDYGCFQVS